MTAVSERVSRARRLAQVKELLAHGLNHREIAETLGITRSAVKSVLNDPDGSKQRSRRKSYAGVCERCGGETKSDGTSRASRVCAACAREIARENRKWTRASVIAAIQRFAQDHGGRAPTATEWRRADPASGYPAATTTHAGSRAPFASWADAVEAAGFERPRVGRRVERERTSRCEDCGAEMTYRGLRTRHRCEGCVKAKQAAYHRRPEVKAKQAAYRRRPEVKAKKAAYNAAYYRRPEVKAKKATYRRRLREEIRSGARLPFSRWHCVECGEPLRRQTEDGLCGFCRQGIAA